MANILQKPKVVGHPRMTSSMKGLQLYCCTYYIRNTLLYIVSFWKVLDGIYFLYRLSKSMK